MLTTTNKVFRAFTVLSLLCILSLRLGAQNENFSDNAVAATDSLATDTIPSLPWPLSLQANVDTVIMNSSLPKTSQMAVLIYDLTADSVLYALNEKQTMRPASTMKLLTAITALDRLGDAYLFKTRLAYSGTIQEDSTLIGNVYCIGGMDPKIGHDDLHAFAMSLREAGIDTIRGNVYADRSMRDDKLFGEGWCWDDPNPVLSPLVYGRKDQLMNKLRETILEEGIVIDDSLALAGASYPISQVAPPDAKIVCERTHTIQQIMQKMMKDSDNLYAESMFYQIGLTQGRPSTAARSKAVIEALLKKLKMSGTPHRLADGSGLSLYNYLSPEIEVAFLRYAFDNANIFTHLYQSLPVAGIDGTLKERMLDTPAANNVRAKTGTVSGVSTLAGYCKSSNGHDLCFAIFNQGVMRSANAKEFQDLLCAAMCK